MKIAMIGHKRIPSREGGIEIVVEELATRLVQMGNSVDVYNRKGHHVSGKEFNLKKADDNYKGVNLFTIFTFENQKLNAMVYSLLATLKAVFKKYDIIHYHAEGPCAMLPIAHFFKTKTVATIHGLDWQRAKWGGFATKYLKFGEKMAVKYADEIIVLSKNAQDYFLKTYNRKTVLIPNGISKPKIIGNEIIQTKWGLSKDSYILFLGRIVPEKGLHYLINSYKSLSTNKKLVIAGGSSHTNDYMNEIKNMAYGNDNIIFTDFVQGQELKELYSNAYIYCLPSDLEGMPLSLLEAMSYDNCCLVSNIAECCEVVEDNGVVFQKGDENDLTQKLSTLLNDFQIVKQYRKSSNIVCNKYNWDNITQKTFDLYKKVVNN